MRIPSVAAMLLVAVTACAEASPTASPGDGDPQGSWELVAGTVNGEPVPILDEYRITLVLEGSRIGGTSACNSYGGELSVEGGRLRIVDLAQTAMACVDEGAMTAEAIYMTGLGAADSIALDGDELLVRGPGVELRFMELAPPPTADLVDTVWILDTLVKGEVASSVPGDPPTLELRSDGTLRGGTGCREFGGTWTEQGDEIVTTRFEVTDQACPAELAGADQHVLGVIGDGFRATIDGDRLTLAGGAGAGLVYRAPPE
jgi:heat shock protein HslJ